MSMKKKGNKGGNGRWTKTEHERFLKGLEKYGRDWVSVQKVVQSRNLTQVRSHAQKVFLKMSEQDIRGLIGEDYEFEGDFQSLESNSEITVVTPKKALEKNFCEIPTRSPVKNLLQIFMDAIQEEGIEINSSEEKNENKPTLDIADQPSSEQEQAEKIEKQTENFFPTNIDLPMILH